MLEIGAYRYPGNGHIDDRWSMSRGRKFIDIRNHGHLHMLHVVEVTTSQTARKLLVMQHIHASLCLPWDGAEGRCSRWSWTRPDHGPADDGKRLCDLDRARIVVFRVAPQDD